MQCTELRFKRCQRGSTGAMPPVRHTGHTHTTQHRRPEQQRISFLLCILYVRSIYQRLHSGFRPVIILSSGAYPIALISSTKRSKNAWYSSGVLATPGMPSSDRSKSAQQYRRQSRVSKTNLPFDRPSAGSFPPIIPPTGRGLLRASHSPRMQMDTGPW